MSRPRKPQPAITRPFAWWVQWWWIDALLAVALVFILHLVARPGTGADVLGELKLTERQGAYADALQITAVFGGFSTVAFTIYLGLNSRSVRRIRKFAGKPLLSAWIASLVIPWLCAVIFVCCGVTDRGDVASGNFTRWIAIATLILVLLQMARLVWIFYQLAAAELEDSSEVKIVSDEELKVVK